MDEDAAAREDRLDALREKRYAQEAADKLDAARYRHLREHCAWVNQGVVQLEFIGEVRCLDSAIDAAIAKWVNLGAELAATTQAAP